MPRTPFPFTGGGVGGFALGVVPNTFADIAARNAQAASDATWLATYDANKGLVVRVGSGTSFDYYRRPVTPTGTDDWEDVTSIVTGPAGTPGAGSLPQTFTDGVILRVTDDGGTLVPGQSSMIEQATNFRMMKQAQAPGSTGFVTGNWERTAQGQTVGYRNLSNNRMYLPVANELLTAGTNRPSSIDLGAVATQFTQPNATTPIAATQSQYQFSNANQMQGTATQYVITKSAGAGTANNCNIIIRFNSHTDPVPLVDYKRDSADGQGFTLGPGDNVIPLPVAAFFEAGVIVYTTIISDDGDNLELVGTMIDLGDGAQLIPAGRIDGRAGNFRELAYRSDIGKGFVGVQFHRSSQVLTYDDANELQTFEATGPYDCTIPPSTEDDQLGDVFHIRNATLGTTVTLNTNTPGHTFILDGGSFPYRMHSGLALTLELVDRDTNSSTYRIKSFEDGTEGTYSTTAVGGSANIAGLGGKPREYSVDPITNNQAVTFTGVGTLQPTETCVARVENVDTAHSLMCSITGNATFRNRRTTRVAIPPRSARTFYINNNAGAVRVAYDGDIEYKFQLHPTDVLTNDGLVMPAVPAEFSGLIAAGTGAQDDSLIIQPGVSGLLDLEIFAIPEYTGAGLFPDGEIVSYGPTINDTQVPGYPAAAIVIDRNRLGIGTTNGPTNTLDRAFRGMSVSPNDQISLNIIGLQNDSNFDMRLTNIAMTVTLRLE